MPPAPLARSLVLPRVLLVLTSIVVALGIAEGIARVIGVPPQFGRVLGPQGMTTRMSDGVALWSDGDPRCTDDDIERAASNPSSFKIVGFGDSITYGVLLPKEQTFLAQTERLLAPRSKRPIEVLNMAVPGFSTLQENALYKEVAGRLRPDLVIVHFWQDDVRQYRMVGGYVVDFGDMSADGRVVARALPIPAAVSDFLLVHSRAYDALTHAVLTYRRLLEPFHWSLVEQPLREMHQRITAAGGTLLVTASADLSGPIPKTIGDFGRLQQLGADAGFPVVDVTPWLSGVSSTDIGLDTCHMNARGHRIVAEHLADYLVDHGLVP